ncbi:MAG TPA: hypothetical protein VGE15_06515 [Sphingobacteriaceae bacterium]
MFRSFSQLKSPSLTIIRSRWFTPDYEITDGTYTYARLTYKGFLWQSAVAETSEAVWTLRFEGFFPRKVVVCNKEDKKVASIELGWLSNRSALTLNGGKQLFFVRESLWNSSFSWEDLKRGKIMTINGQHFSRKVASLEIHDKVVANPLIPLLSLLALHLVLVKRRKHLAAA